MCELILAEHFRRYPRMQIADAVKLIFQNEFGSGHMAPEAESSLIAIEAEMNCAPSAHEIFEDIGGDLCRVHLGCAAETGISAKLINRFFLSTAAKARGSVKSFEEKLKIFLGMCHDGRIDFDPQTVEAYLRQYREAGYPPVSHSEEYRSAYMPAYRVIRAEYAAYIEAFIETEKLSGRNDCAVVAIDGNSGAGKSMLANLLSDVFDCNVFHIDDYFLRPEQRTNARLSEPGGNFDRERFGMEVIAGINSRNAVYAARYDCRTGSLGEKMPYPRKRVNIIEGCYSMHPELIGNYDLCIFMETDSETQKRRILERNGPEMLGRFLSEWIPLENTYFEKFNIRGKCQLIFSQTCSRD